MILGIDEVGRGPWAGPLVVGAVILGGAEIDGLDDSKKLTKKRREALDVEIREKAAAWALGWVSAQELDAIGMSEALRLATRRAVEQVQVQCRQQNLAFSEVIIDGKVNFLRGTALEKFAMTMPKADGLIPSVSAASIVAKMARDQFMAEQAAVYPGYGFASNAGYGVAKHRAAIERLGVTPLHRLSFAPLAKYAVTPRAVPQKKSGQLYVGPEFFSDGTRETNRKSAPTEETKIPVTNHKQELIKLLNYHLDLFDRYQPTLGRPFETLKRFFKIYIRGFDGAKELREQLMNTKNTDEVRQLINSN